MKFYTAIFATAAVALASPTVAQNITTQGKVEVVERNADGKATKVLAQDKVYTVCMTQNQDSCIQPRAAGLNWGDVPLRYWPGQPASMNSKGATK